MGCNVVIDPQFRAQFQLGQRDAEYDSFLTQEIPEVFVDVPATLVAMLREVCRMMHAALGRLGLPVPPWRSTSAIMSKFAPVKYTEEHIVAPPPGIIKVYPGVKQDLRGSSATKIMTCSEPRRIVSGFFVRGQTEEQPSSSEPCQTREPEPSARATVVHVVHDQDTRQARNVHGSFTSMSTSLTEHGNSFQLQLVVRSMSDWGCCASSFGQQYRKSVEPVAEDRGDIDSRALPYRPLQDLLPQIRTVKRNGAAVRE